MSDHHRYLLILGSGSGQETQLRRARDTLKQRGKILARSGVIHAPSVVPGDAERYANQSVLFASAMPREVFAPWLKSLEQALGRRPDEVQCAIDIDLVGECDAQGAVLWENPAKLQHDLFRDLVARVLRRWAKP